MKDAAQYPVSFPYGAKSAPYGTAALPYHRGDDRACPTGTPVIIGGVTIGLTGATGLVTGPHLHLQEWTGNSYFNDRKPQNAFKPGVVTQAGFLSQFGNYVTIQQPDGSNDTYCHLSVFYVKIGQVIGDEPVIQNTDQEYSRWKQTAYMIRGRELSRQEFINAGVGKTWLQAIEILEDSDEAVATQNAQNVGQVALRDKWEERLGALQNERDKILYPYVNGVSEALGLPAKADVKAATDAIKNLGGDATSKLKQIKEIIG